MADNSTGLPVKTLATETVRSKVVDTGGTNEATVSAGGALKIDGSSVTQPVSDAAGSLTVDAPIGTPVYVRLSDGAANLIGQKAMAASVPVTIASDQSAIPVTGSFTADTELPPAAALTDALAGFNVPSVGSMLLGYNGATYDRVRTANTGRLQVDVVSGGGANASILVDNAAFTDGTSSVAASGYIFDDVAGTALTENDVAAARIDSKRAQVFVGEDATTRAQKWSISAAGALSSNITQVGGASISAAVPLPNRLTDGAAYYTKTGQTAGTAAYAQLSDQTNTVAVIAATNALKMDLSSVGGTATGTANIAGVQAIGGPTAADAALTAYPQTIGARASAAVPAAMSADGDVVNVWASLNGALNVTLRDASGNYVSAGGGTQYVGDAVATATPTGALALGLANAAAPTDVSANNDAVAQWMLRNGSAVVNLASGGTLITIGQKAMVASVPVVISSDQSALGVTGTFWQATQPVSGTFWQATQPVSIAGSVAVTIAATQSTNVAQFGGVAVQAASAPADAASNAQNMTKNDTYPSVFNGATWDRTRSASGDASAVTGLQAAAGMGFNGTTWDRLRTVGTGVLKTDFSTIVGAVPSATNVLPARMTDGAAYYTLTGQSAATAPYSRITDATNTATVIATINALKTDFSSVAGAAPSATNAVPVRLTDGTAFYASLSGAPSTPTVSTVTSAALGAGASVDLDHTLLTAGQTGQLQGIDVASTVPLKVEIKTVDAANAATTRVVLFAPTYSGIQWRSPYKTYITRAGAAANARFRVTCTNKDANVAADVYSTAYFDII